MKFVQEKLSILATFILAVGCASGTSRAPSSATTFQVSAELLRDDEDILRSLDIVKKSDIGKRGFFLQEIVTNFTASADDPSIPNQLKDASFVATYARPVESLGPKYFIGIVHFLNGKTELRYLIESKERGRNFLTLGVGASFIFNGKLSPAEEEKIMELAKSVDPEFQGSFVIHRILMTTKFLSPDSIQKMHKMFSRGVEGVSAKLKEFEILPARYNLPSVSARAQLKLPVEDVRTQMRQYQLLKGAGVKYKLEPSGIRPMLAE